MADCFDEAKKAFGSVFNDKDIKDAIDSLNESTETAAAENARLHDVLVNKSDDLKSKFQADSDEKEFLFYRNLELKQKQIVKAKRFADRKDPINEAVKSSISGTQTGVRGSRASAQVQIRSSQERGIGLLEKDLEDENQQVHWIARKSEVDIADELMGNSTGNESAVKIAELVTKVHDEIDHLYKRQAVFIDDLDNRVARNVHDPVELMKTHDNVVASTNWRKDQLLIHKGGVPKDVVFEKAFQRWKDFNHPSIEGSLYDVKRTFKKHPFDYDKQVVFLRNAFNTLTNGGNIYDDSENIISSVKKHRILHYKDGASLVKSNKKFGAGTVQDAILGDITNSYKNIGILENFGHKPKTMIKSIVQTLESDDQKLKFKFHKKAELDKLLNLYDDMAGNFNDPSSKAATVAARIRAWTSITKLGSVVLTAVTDIAPISLEMGRAQGSFLKGVGKSVSTLMEGKSSVEKKTINGLLGVINTAINGETHRLLSTGESPGKALNKLQRIMFKIGGLQWWDKTFRGGLANMLSNMMAQSKHIEFDSLPARDKHILLQYNLDDKWDIIRKSEIKMADGKEYITPDSIRSVDDETIKAHLRKMGVKRITRTRINDLKRDIEVNMGAYFEDRMNHAILHPDAADNQFFLRGTRSGQFWGVMARFVAQFKMWPTAFITKPLARLVYGGGAESLYDSLVRGKGDRLGMMQLMLSATALGYISNAAKDIASNRTPDDPFSRLTWLKAAQQGGGWGIAGDYVFTNFNKFGSNILTKTAGSSLNNMADIADFLSGMLHGQASGTALKHIIQGNTPLIRQWYTKAPYDFVFNHTIGQGLEPDYYQKRMHQLKKNNKDFIISP